MEVRPIARVSSPYKQKFAVPRQANLVREAIGELVFEPEFSDLNCLRGLERFSHLWLVFVFHETAAQGWSPTVTPPRLGGSRKVGVFASRSTFRPNAIGLSVVEFAGYEQRGSQLLLRVRGLDLVEGTPILDIKPYLPYADCIVDASGGFAAEAPPAKLAVEFAPQALDQLAGFGGQYPELGNFIRHVLEQDPRPAVHVRQQSDRVYGTFLHDLNVRWQVRDSVCMVLAIEPAAGVTAVPPEDAAEP